MKSVLCDFFFCVVFAVHDMVIDICRAALDKFKVKISPMHRRSFKKKFLKTKFEKKDKGKQKVTPGKSKWSQWKQGLWKQQKNKDDKPGK